MNKKSITVIAIAIMVAIGIGITFSYIMTPESIPEMTLDNPENVEPNHYSVTLSESAQVNSP